jgi:hypothetical protein
VLHVVHGFEQGDGHRALAEEESDGERPERGAERRRKREAALERLRPWATAHDATAAAVDTWADALLVAITDGTLQKARAALAAVVGAYDDLRELAGRFDVALPAIPDEVRALLPAESDGKGEGPEPDTPAPVIIEDAGVLAPSVS